MSKVQLTILATINPEGKEDLAYYLEHVGELYAKVKAVPLNKFKVTKSLTGGDIPSLISIMEFPNMDAFKNVFESDDYKKLLPFREKAFSKLEAYISE